MAPRKATRAAASNKDANGPRRVDQAGQLIGRKATSATTTAQGPQADAADGLTVCTTARSRSASSSNATASASPLTRAASMSARSRPAERARYRRTRSHALTRGSPSGVIGAGADKIVVDEGGKP